MFCGQQPRFLINPHKNKVHCQLVVSIRQYIADERSLANETLSYGLFTSFKPLYQWENIAPVAKVLGPGVRMR